MNPERFATAVGLAARLHQHQVRKGTRVAYLSHLLSVAALVAEDGGSETEVLGGLLHDAAEDQGGEGTLALIESTLGGDVAEIVRECSDSLGEAGQVKAPWEERKREAIRRLEIASLGALRVVAADKLHNTRATLADLVISGDEVWGRFKTGREGFFWYHARVLDLLQRRLPCSRSVQLLARDLSQLQSSAGLARA
jgi:(p)ppGpp synthase/HD superfamily hydrolase